MTTTTTVTVGSRIHWDGDMANRARNGVVVSITDGHYMTVRWDDGTTAVRIPVALMRHANWWFNAEAV